MRETFLMVSSEARLFLRDPGAWIFGVLLPTLILVCLGAIPALREPSPDFGGATFLDVFVPSLLVVTLAALGMNLLPIRLATYRERGVLRRLSTTPARPRSLLFAQLVLYLAAAAGSIVLLLVTARLVFGVALPRQPVAFVIALVLGAAALFAFGLMIAAVSPTARFATGLALPVFFGVLFVGGVYLPRMMLPDAVVAIGRFTPPGVQQLSDAWRGTAPAWNSVDGLLPVVIMAVVAVAAGTVAARIFRWE